MSSPADPLLLSLFQAQVLDPTQVAAIRSWATEQAATPEEAVRELDRRGWLTTYQAREINRGNLASLSIGPYVLLDVLGEGGMGRVFRARHTRLGRDVALKVIRQDKLSNPAVVNRFQQEIHAAAQLSHPNVVMAFDAESADNNLFLSMEYVEGTDLTKLVQQNGPMPLAHACDAIRQAAIGLQHAYERGLVHRDIKPSNLLYTPRGQVKLLDLGLAMLNRTVLPGGENANRVTQEGFVLGTPDFLAPEQAQNPAGVDIRADIYGLGATLFYLLTARVPFEATSPTDKLLKHITEPPPNLLAFRPEAPPQLASIIQWMMAKRPEDRPQTPAQVAATLAPFGLHPSASLPVAATEKPRPIAAPITHRPEFVPTVADRVSVREAPPDVNEAFADLEDDDPPSTNEPRRREARGRDSKKGSALLLLLIGVGIAFVACAGVGVAAFVFISQAIEGSKPLPDEVVTGVGGIKLVKVEPGTFEMGSTDEEDGHQPHEGPIHTVTLTQPYLMSVTEITRQQYFDVTGSYPSITPPRLSDKLLPRMPATVSWNEAMAFVDKLNRRSPGPKRGWVYRLPTEAEWEYAAREGGKSGPFGERTRLMQYRDGIFMLGAEDSYGESNPTPPLDKYYTFENKPCGIAPTEADPDYMYRREPNALGMYDLVGNVWELCYDRYDNYPSDAGTDPHGPDEGGQRVARGGAYNTTATECRAASRRILEPGRAYPNVGFRIVFGPVIAK